jgi:hypothetical protein
MSGFFNAQNVTAGKIVADFLVASCSVEIPAEATACACLEVRARDPPRTCDPAAGGAAQADGRTRAGEGGLARHRSHTQGQKLGKGAAHKIP